MTTLTAWNKFINSGSVQDYLAYRREYNSQKEQGQLEVHDRRTDNKRK